MFKIVLLLAFLVVIRGVPHLTITKLSEAVVSIENFRGIHICNGILVDKDVVLTAAHCVYSVENFTVRAKSVIVGFGGEVVDVLKNCPVKDFDFITKNHDISVLRLNSSITGIRPAKLPSSDDEIDRLTALSIQGWGFSTRGILLAIPALPILDNICTNIYGYEAVTESMKCLVYPSGVSACLDGAQGSPVLYRNTVVGINAALGVCALGNSPAIFTKIFGSRIQEDIDECK